MKIKYNELFDKFVVFKYNYIKKNLDYEKNKHYLVLQVKMDLI